MARSPFRLSIFADWLCWELRRNRKGIWIISFLKNLTLSAGRDSINFVALRVNNYHVLFACSHPLIRQSCCFINPANYRGKSNNMGLKSDPLLMFGIPKDICAIKNTNAIFVVRPHHTIHRNHDPSSHDSQQNTLNLHSHSRDVIYIHAAQLMIHLMHHFTHENCS